MSASSPISVSLAGDLEKQVIDSFVVCVQRGIDVPHIYVGLHHPPRDSGYTSPFIPACDCKELIKLIEWVANLNLRPTLGSSGGERSLGGLCQMVSAAPGPPLSPHAIAKRWLKSEGNCLRQLLRPSETKIPTFALASRRDGPDVRKQKVSGVKNFSLALVSPSLTRGSGHTEHPGYLL